MKMDSGFNLHLPAEVEISKSAYTFILACDLSHIHNSPAGICTSAARPAERDVRLRSAGMTTCSPSAHFQEGIYGSLNDRRQLVPGTQPPPRSHLSRPKVS